ncbi:hypothetical protein B0H10DRAFT_2320400 [Mycena sp. CBHHK59/15]|nr:hypothetical protein B0H10DRAFT_2320400 [Mycena sp. CBHHK59/15]
MADMGSLSACPDCNKSFKRREGDGQCPKCVKLAAHPRTSDVYGDIETWDQCLMCGVTRRNNMHVTLQGNNHIITCGSDLCKAEITGPVQEHRPATHNVPNTVLDRAVITRDRFKLAPSNRGATSTLRTQTLLLHERGEGDPGRRSAWLLGRYGRTDFLRFIFILDQVRVKKTVVADLGQGAKLWAMSKLLPDIKAR